MTAAEFLTADEPQQQSAADFLRADDTPQPSFDTAKVSPELQRDILFKKQAIDTRNVGGDIEPTTDFLTAVSKPVVAGVDKALNNPVTKGIGTAFDVTGKILSTEAKAILDYAARKGKTDLSKDEFSSLLDQIQGSGGQDPTPSPYDEARQSLPIVPRAAAGVGMGLIEQAPRLALAAVQPEAGAASFGFTPQGFDPIQAGTMLLAPEGGKLLGNIADKLAVKAGITSDAARETISKFGGATGIASIMSAPSVYQISQIPEGEERNKAIEDTAANAMTVFLLGLTGKPIEGGQNASTIRSDTGQLPQERSPIEGSQTPSGNDLEQAASIQPKSVEQGKAAQAEVIKTLPSEPQAQETVAGNVTKGIDFSSIQNPHKAGVEKGIPLTEKDIPALKDEQDKANTEMRNAAESGNGDAYKAAFGKTTYLQGIIEGAQKSGANYDAYLKEKNANPEQSPASQLIKAPAVSAPSQPPAEPVTPAGAAASVETPIGDTQSTGLTEEKVNQERGDLGQEPIEKDTPISNEQTLEGGRQELANNPNRANEVMERLRTATPEERSISRRDAAVLLAEKRRLITTRNSAAETIENENSTPEQKTIAKQSWNELNDKIDKMDQAAQDARSVWGGFGQFWQRMLKEDYTFDALRRKASIKLDRPLTDSELSDLQKKADEFADAAADREKKESEYQSSLADAHADSTYSEIIGETSKEREHLPTFAPHVIAAAERFASRMDSAADAAWIRIQKRMGRMNVGVDPTLLSDTAIIGAAKFTRGIVSLGKFTDAMVSHVGEWVKPYIEKVFKMSKKLSESKAKKELGTNSEKSKRILSKEKKVGSRDNEAEKASIVDGIKEAAADGADYSEIGRYAKELAKNFIRLEVEKGRSPKDIKGGEIDAAVHDVLKDIFPEITPVESRDAWTGYGKYKQLNTDKIDVRLREARAEQQKLSTLERLQKGEAGLKTGQERQAPTDLTRRREKQIAQLKKELGIKTTDPETQLRSALDAKLTRQKNRIKDLKFENATRKKIVREKTASPDNEETLRNKAEIAELEKQNREIFGNRTLTDAQKLQMAKAAAEKSEAEWSKRLEDAKKGKFESVQKSKPLTTKEIDAIRARRDALASEVKELQNLDAHFQAEKEARELPAKLADVESRINKAVNDINNGTIEAKNNPSKSVNQQLARKRAELADLNRIKQQLRNASKPRKSPEEIALNSRLTRLKNQEAELMAQKARNDFTPKPKPIPRIKSPQALAKVAAATARVEKLKQEADRWAERKRLSERTPVKKLADTLWLLARRGASTVAVSFHGTVFMVTHAGALIYRPSIAKLYWTNFARQFKLWASEKFYNETAYKIKTDPDFADAKKSGLDIDPDRAYTDYEYYLGSFGKHLGAILGARGALALKVVRLQLFKDEVAKIPRDIRSDPEQYIETKKQLASMVNKSTGVTNLFGQIENLKASEVAHFVLFAPKLYASRWARVVLDPARTLKTLSDMAVSKSVNRVIDANWKEPSKADQQLAVRRTIHAAEFAVTYLGALAINQGLLSASDSKQKVNFFQPSKSDWLKFKVHGKVVTADGGLLDPIRLIGQIVAHDMMARSGKDRFERGNNFEAIVKDLGKYVRGKFSPSFGLIVDEGTGQDFQGRSVPRPFGLPRVPSQFKIETPYTVGEYATTKAPIPIADASKLIHDTMVAKGISSPDAITLMAGAGAAALAATGVSDRTDYDVEKKK